VDEGLSVACDGLLMGHVFYNLLNNAYQAMSERGRLEVRIRKASDADVLVDVIDDGKGINSKIYHLITEPYITDKPDGSGLGLAMSKLTVEQHGGDLTYTSREKRTKFTIRLPFTYKQKLQPA
jgi:signal transduction histidine kinase